MQTYRYTLQKGGRKHLCPLCQQKTFARYIDTHNNGIYLPEQYGRCDREIKCAYHHSPYHDGYGRESNAHWRQHALRPYAPPLRTTKPVPAVAQEPSTIADDIFSHSLRDGHSNHLRSFLLRHFSPKQVEALFIEYMIGSSSHWPGATVFWQADIQGCIRTGKIMLYHPDTGRRVKKPYNHIAWVHSQLKDKGEYHLQQCLFGEHLLVNDPDKAVALVESEKTALIASACLPQYIWLATGGLSNLNTERCTALKGRSLYLFPDLNAHSRWLPKARSLSDLAASVAISPYLENNASPDMRAEGWDIGDFLLGKP